MQKHPRIEASQLPVGQQSANRYRGRRQPADADFKSSLSSIPRSSSRTFQGPRS
jgi:hypothetical protein